MNNYKFSSVVVRNIDSRSVYISTSQWCDAIVGGPLERELLLKSDIFSFPFLLRLYWILIAWSDLYLKWNVSDLAISTCRTYCKGIILVFRAITSGFVLEKLSSLKWSVPWIRGELVPLHWLEHSVSRRSGSSCSLFSFLASQISVLTGEQLSSDIARLFFYSLAFWFAISELSTENNTKLRTSNDMLRPGIVLVFVHPLAR